MKQRKWPLVAALSFSALLIVACGDNKDPRLSDSDILCMKVQKHGGSCNPNGTSGGTSTVTNTTTQTQTVTINNS